MFHNMFPLFLFQNQQIFLCFIALIYLIPLISASGPSCKPPHITVQKLKDIYVFVNKPVGGSRKRRAQQTPITGNKWCPWTWATQTDKSRQPQNIVYAKCDNCSKTACKTIYMYHQVLTWAPTCDPNTGDKYRIWSVTRLPIAFIYTGNIN